MMTFVRSLVALSLLAFVASMAGCGDTWQGLKKDTGENLEKTGAALERVGEKVQGDGPQDEEGPEEGLPQE